MSSSGGDGGATPQQQENPVVQWYRNWTATTPFITRATLQLLVVLWALSWIVDPASYVVNVPALTVLRFQLWRVVTSPLYSEGLISVLFICLSMGTLATTLEQSLGSTAFTLLMVTLALGTNLLFLVLAFCLYLVMGSRALFMMAGSFWLIVLGLITVDCLQMPEASRQISAKYLPLLLYALFALFAGPRLDMACAIALGYAHGFGYLKFMEPSERTLARLEELRPWSLLAAKPGFVLHTQARGQQAWLPTVVMPAPAGNGGGGRAAGGLAGFGGSGAQALGGGGSSSSSSSSSTAAPGANRGPPTVHTMGGGAGGSKAPATTQQQSAAPSFQGSGHTLGGTSSSSGGGGVRGFFRGSGRGSGGNEGGGAGHGRGGSVLTDPRAVAEARAAKFSAPNGPMAPSSNDDEKETATLLRR